MTRVPIRVRLTAAFALATVLVLTGAGLFIYVRLSADLNESVDGELRARAAAVEGGRTRAVGEPTEGFAQVLGRGGGVLARTGGARGAALSPPELRRATRAPLVLERDVSGIDGETRVLARPGPRGRVIAVGRSLDDRDEALSGLIAAFALGGPLAVLLASALGYGLAASALRPVEVMRRRAASVSLTGAHERLPLPDAQDEVRRLGETLNEMLERLRASFERERRFVADASHELRTPLAVIKAELETALHSGRLEAETREALVAAAEECDQLAQLAEDLLVLARSADGQLPVSLERLDATELLEGVRARFADRAAERGRAIRIEAESGLSVGGDRLRLRQALGNLVDNALRHGEGEVALCARRAEGDVELEVSDGGAGFGELSERAFERFVRGDAARTRGGAGLGLAIVRAVVEAHGGTAVADPAGGASVWLRIPSQGDLSDAPYARPREGQAM